MPFPKDFLWGTATAAHQVEGNNTNSDWWKWEQSKDYKTGKNKLTGQDQKWPLEPSGDACDSYNRYEEDFDLCKQMNNNAVRFSVEWARLEPEEGKFSDKEFDHYKKVIAAAKKRGLKVFLTLHHFTNPQWFAEKGSWAKKSNIKYFTRYAKKCAEEFGETVEVYLTINEPQVYALESYYVGEWYPGEKSFIKSTQVQFNLIKAHKEAYKAIKSVDSHYIVGIVQHVVWNETTSKFYAFWDHLYTDLMNYFSSTFILAPLRKHMDVIGINYYFTGRRKNFKSVNKNDWTSDMNWWIYPDGLFNILMRLKKYKIPVYVTENGIADENDKHRERFLNEMIFACDRAIHGGVDLRGYFYWSLLDNYEWHQGYWPKFGLVEIDRKNNLERKPRKSFYYYARQSQ